jgi:hypothetical protein
MTTVNELKDQRRRLMALSRAYKSQMYGAAPGAAPEGFHALKCVDEARMWLGKIIFAIERDANKDTIDAYAESVDPTNDVIAPTVDPPSQEKIHTIIDQTIQLGLIGSIKFIRKELDSIYMTIDRLSMTPDFKDWLEENAEIDNETLDYPIGYICLLQIRISLVTAKMWFGGMLEKIQINQSKF